MSRFFFLFFYSLQFRIYNILYRRENANLKLLRKQHETALSDIQEQRMQVLYHTSIPPLSLSLLTVQIAQTMD
jgi:hypothetical protein